MLFSGATGVRRFPSPGRSSLGAGSQGVLPTCCERGCAGAGGWHCLIGVHALRGLRAAGVAAGCPRKGDLSLL